jgi:hypothetical protein
MRDIVESAAGFGDWMNQMSEDHAKFLDKEIVVAIQPFEDFRARVKQVVETSYPEKMEAFVKAFSALDKSMAGVTKFVKTL